MRYLLTVNIEQDFWTCSEKMRYEISEFFNYRSNFKIAEIGSHKGYSTKVFSKIFSHVYAVDNNLSFIKFNKNYNKDITNITYVNLDIYKNSWNVLPEDIEVFFIDAVHDYEHCKSDIFNSVKRSRKIKYIVFDDYGAWPGVKKIIDELMKVDVLRFQRFIGIRDVPYTGGIVKNTNEGIICSVNRETFYEKMIYPDILKGKKYTWESSSITFAENFRMHAFGMGNYFHYGSFNIVAIFGGEIHDIEFGDYYKTFKSIRRRDGKIELGKLI